MPKIPRKAEGSGTLFPEPDHEPEFQAQARYEGLRDGVSLRGVPEPEVVAETPETATEPPETEPLFPTPRLTPATPEEIDYDHDCDIPSHLPWMMQWNIANGFPPPRDYVTCKGYRRLQVRSAAELRGGVAPGR